MAEIMYISNQTAEDYDGMFPQRLDASTLTQSAMVNLMFRCHGVDPEAYLGPVVVHAIKRRMGSIGLKLNFVNQDLRPIGTAIPSIVRQNVWEPERPYPLVTRCKKVDTVTRQGYFLPYEAASLDDDIDEMNALFESILQEEAATAHLAGST